VNLGKGRLQIRPRENAPLQRSEPLDETLVAGDIHNAI
jgi:hypothetical protein